MKAILPLCIAALALSACDSVEREAYTPSDPSTLVGEWTEQPSESTLFATPAVDTDVPNFDEVEGALTVRGAVSADLNTVSSAFRVNDTRAVLQADSGGPAGERQADNPRVAIYINGGLILVTVTSIGSQTRFSAGDFEGPPRFSYADGKLVLLPATLRADSGAEIQVGGTLTVASTRLQAGREYVLSFNSCIPCENGGTVWVFGDAGAFERRIRVELLFARDQTRIEEGTWEPLGPGRIALAMSADDSRTYTLNGSGQTARLTEERVPYDEPGLRSVENQYYLPVGSLGEARFLNVFTIAR